MLSLAWAIYQDARLKALKEKCERRDFSGLSPANGAGSRKRTEMLSWLDSPEHTASPFLVRQVRKVIRFSPLRGGEHALKENPQKRLLPATQEKLD